MGQTEKTVYLKDYQAPQFNIDEVFLYFDLTPEVTIVKSVMHLQRKKDADSKAALVLDGEDLILKSVHINGETFNDYQVTDENLMLNKVPDQFILEIVVEIKPHENTKLSGLYLSHNNYCTQCESHGFRRITYFLDRPDVLTHFTTAISADKKSFPILLSNGNLLEVKDLEDGRHWVKWEDPSLKPCYLFALVAGDFENLTDTFTTCSGREVELNVFVELGKLDQADHAMASLKRSMKWDEERFGREYDLDIFNIVAVGDFNFGAMENKSLNIFNTKYILAKPETATDQDYIDIEAVIGHEYFHNWSGDRVTCRDWFQITLKEGFTVFRDQSFTMDMHSAAVKRIHDAKIIRSAQFQEDSGPMAHPIQPKSYIEMNNFYTVTVYNKGAEVIRMLHTLLGEAVFRKGTDLYFSKYDGCAVTTEEFVQSMEEVSGKDLKQFRRWYAQAGTPMITVTDHYDEAHKKYSLTLAQKTLPTADASPKETFFFPLRVGLLMNDQVEERLFEISEEKQTFEFENISSKPLPSINCNFSAPIKVVYDYSDEDLMYLLAHDTDDFNRWDAGQKLFLSVIDKLLGNIKYEQPLTLGSEIAEAFRLVLNNQNLDKALVAEMLMIPSESLIMQQQKVIDVDAIFQARLFLKQKLADLLKDTFRHVYHENKIDTAYEWTADQIKMRSLKNVCLNYLVSLGDADVLALSTQQFTNSDNMTDSFAALSALNQVDCPDRDQALGEFYHRWQQEDLVVDKWLSLHAVAPINTALDKVRALTKHAAFDIKNPNKVRSLIGLFMSQNHVNFHSLNAEGYRFAAEHILALDKINPQVATRITTPMIQWKKYDEKRQVLLQKTLKDIMQNKLSKDLFEVVSKSLV